MIGALILIGYLAGAVLTYGLVLAFFQRNYTLIARECLNEDRAFALFIAAIWPIGLIAAFFTTGCFKHGILYR